MRLHGGAGHATISGTPTGSARKYVLQLRANNGRKAPQRFTLTVVAR
jgi:hypothetical protein